MGFLVAFGTVIVKTMAELTIVPVIRQVGYVIYYNKNLKKLESRVGKLGDARESMQHDIETEERKGKKIEKGVEKWLTEVDEMTKQANDFLKDEQHAQTRCFSGFCPNLKLRHHLSRKSTKLIQQVDEISVKNDFAKIAYEDKAQEVFSICTRDYQAFDSRTSLVEKIMHELRQSITGMIGVYGVGGVGKTTLAKEVYLQATEDNTLFDDVVILLDVQRIPDLEGIQKRIVEKLGMDVLGDETIDKRASRLCGRIKDKKVLVILDDIRQKVDLEIVGVPRVSNCKVFLTSRTREVLSVEMNTQKEFPLDLLDAEENWGLFEKMAGVVVQNPTIRKVATQVAKKCGGLPVLVVTVASALKTRSTLPDWRDALRRLKGFDKHGLTEKAYLALEWSYEQLHYEELKPLFLLSGIIRGYSINLLDLLKYSMGLGLIKNVDTMEEAHDSLHSLVEKLKDSCLLLEDSDNRYVRMHDLVHEVACRIASKDQHVFKVAIGDEFKEWPTKDFCKKSTMIVLESCSIPNLPEGLECPELKMFTFTSSDFDHYLKIPDSFFEGTKKLQVLDLTNLSIPVLPPSLQFLKCLQTLCLDNCTLGDIALVGELRNLEILSLLRSKFKKLPKEIGQLTRLRLLDLADCSQLEVISSNVLSSLKRLEHLRMRNSFNLWEAGGVTASERSNTNLEELKQLLQLTVLQLHIPDANILPPDLFTGSKLERFQICIGSVWKWDDVDEAMNALKLQLTTSNQFDQGLQMLLNRTEDLYLEGKEINTIVYQLGAGGLQKLKHLHFQSNAELTNLTSIINEKVGYLNLTWLSVGELNGLRFLLSSSMARSLANLKHLEVFGCRIMEEIVSIEDSIEEDTKNLFCQLHDLELRSLPKLTKFCSRIHDIVIHRSLFDNKVELPNLKKLLVSGLEKLTTIWNSQFCLGTSKSLELVVIDSCHNMKNIFPASMVKSLKKLSKLMVYNCGVEEIIAIEGKPQTMPKFVFSKVTIMNFTNLPLLKCFYPAMHASSWPALQSLQVVQCNKLEIFADKLSTFQGNKLSTKQTLFSIEKDSFANLGYLTIWNMEIWNGPLPVDFFRKLKSITVCCPKSKSVVFLDKLLDEGNSSTSTRETNNAVEIVTLPHLRELDLRSMPNLMHLGEDDSQSAPRIPNFPNLEVLLLTDCDNLRNLRSSSICFKNLTTLEVRFCKGLKYLLTYSVARGLIQLIKLEVEDCKRLVCIVGGTQEDNSGHNNEITFGSLKHLKLSSLPRLQGFCFGNCIAKLPSLETLTMSNRLKLKIFPALDETRQLTNEENDTDVDYCESILRVEDEMNWESTDLMP